MHEFLILRPGLQEDLFDLRRLEIELRLKELEEVRSAALCLGRIGNVEPDEFRVALGRVALPLFRRRRDQVELVGKGLERLRGEAPLGERFGPEVFMEGVADLVGDDLDIVRVLCAHDLAFRLEDPQGLPDEAARPDREIELLLEELPDLAPAHGLLGLAALLRRPAEAGLGAHEERPLAGRRRPQGPDLARGEDFKILPPTLRGAGGVREYFCFCGVDNGFRAVSGTIEAEVS